MMTDRVIVVSDLHLAVPGPLNNFHAGERLASFVAEMARPEVTLLFAGDAFDFLQIEGRSETMDGATMPALIATTLDAVAATSWGRSLFDALGALLSCGGRFVVVPGNHDPELVHPAFATQLLSHAGVATDHAGLSVHADGPWRTRVGIREVIVGHGHRHDPWNDIDPAVVQAALGRCPSRLPPGSRLVTEVLNPFKDARDAFGLARFPFVDLLKPELPAVPLLLLYLDRALAMKHLPRALGLSAEKLARALAKALTGGGTLAPATSSGEHEPADQIADALAPTYTAMQRSNAGRAATELEEWLLGAEESAIVHGTLASHSGMRRRMLRAFLAAASDGGRFFDRAHRSEDCVMIAREHLPVEAPPRVVIAGHTHAAREVWLTAEHVYLNTGTWTDLMAFPSVVDDAALKTWIDALEARNVPRVRHLTYAEVTPGGAALREFPSS